MMRANSCPKCQSAMSEGFVPAERGGVQNVSSWLAGVPRKTWFGVRSSSKRLEISTWRCQRCGFLEHYARG